MITLLNIPWHTHKRNTRYSTFPNKSPEYIYIYTPHLRNLWLTRIWIWQFRWEQLHMWWALQASSPPPACSVGCPWGWAPWPESNPHPPGSLPVASPPSHDLVSSSNCPPPAETDGDLWSRKRYEFSHDSCPWVGLWHEQPTTICFDICVFAKNCYVTMLQTQFLCGKCI